MSLKSHFCLPDVFLNLATTVRSNVFFNAVFASVFIVQLFLIKKSCCYQLFLLFSVFCNKSLVDIFSNSDTLALLTRSPLARSIHLSEICFLFPHELHTSGNAFIVQLLLLL